jgi:hypothetical protein
MIKLNGDQKYCPTRRVSETSINSYDTRSSDNKISWLKPVNEKDKVHIGLRTPIIDNPAKLYYEQNQDFNVSSRKSIGAPVAQPINIKQ